MDRRLPFSPLGFTDLVNRRQALKLPQNLDALSAGVQPGVPRQAQSYYPGMPGQGAVNDVLLPLQNRVMPPGPDEMPWGPNEGIGAMMRSELGLARLREMVEFMRAIPYRQGDQ